MCLSFVSLVIRDDHGDDAVNGRVFHVDTFSLFVNTLNGLCCGIPDAHVGI